ncbi:EamA family transporter [Halocatena marina]|uniref:EamA family transporter n=1 Tax=Halocatena marina TaxID=2934937 RepID=UPI0035A0F142
MNKICSIGIFILLGILWRSSFVATEAGLPYFPPLLFAALRYYVAGIAILVYVFLTVDYCWPRSSRDWIVIGIAGAFLIGDNLAFLYIGQRFFSGVIAAVGICLGPILTTVFATALLDDFNNFLGYSWTHTWPC